MTQTRQILSLLAVAAFVLPVLAQHAYLSFDTTDVSLGKAEYSPYLDQGYPNPA